MAGVGGEMNPECTRAATADVPTLLSLWLSCRRFGVLSWWPLLWWCLCFPIVQVVGYAVGTRDTKGGAIGTDGITGTWDAKEGAARTDGLEDSAAYWLPWTL